MSKRANQQPMTSAVGFELAELLSQRAEAASAAETKLRAATREANEATKGLAEQKRQLQALRDSVGAEIDKLVQERIETAVATGLNRYEGVLEESIGKAEAAVNRRFDRLSNILLGNERSDKGTSLVQYTELLASKFYLNWDSFYQYLMSALWISKGCNASNCGRPAKYAVMLKNVHVALDVADIIPAGENPEEYAMEGHMHMCRGHYLDAKASGEVLRSFSLATQVCPFKHDELTPGNVDFLPEGEN